MTRSSLRQLLWLCAIAIVAIALPIKAADTSPIKVACVGNSITYGYGIPDRENNSYPAKLAKLLGPDYIVGNFGYSGATLLSNGHRPYVRQEAYANLLKFAPDIAVIHLGINDTDPRNWPNLSHHFVPDYCALIDTLRAVNPSVRIILANLSPISASHRRFTTGTRLWRDSIRALIPQIAKFKGAELIDFEEPLRDTPHLYIDAVHPDSTGATLLAQYTVGHVAPTHIPARFALPFADSMVVQRQRPLPIYGTATPGSSLTISVDNRTYPATTDASGRWNVTTQPLYDKGPHTITLTAPDTTITLHDILAGEVWIASGQSNMQFQLKATSDSHTSSARLTDSNMRMFMFQSPITTFNFEWSNDIRARIDSLNYFDAPVWHTLSPSVAPEMSAVAYHFARQLRDSMPNTPIGIIINPCGGAPAESYIDIETLKQSLPGVLADWRNNDYVQPWCQKRAVRNAGTSSRHPFEPSYLFAAAVRPLGPLPLAGVIWYQGESNAHNPDLHTRIFPLLVKSWRNHFRDPQLPFLTVQLSSLSTRTSWPAFRNSQRILADSMPNVYMAVSLDVGDSLDVHPTRKAPIGNRLARLALHHIYNFSHLIPSGPAPESAVLCDSSVIITFANSGSGLCAAGKDRIIGFELAEHPGLFFPATAVKGPQPNQLTITAMNIKSPRFVRYAWQPYTNANLVNSDSIPASTFEMPVDGATTLSAEPTPGYNEGVSAPFAALMPQGVIMAGGCNFPGRPFAPDAKKRFYSDIYLLPTDSATGALLSPQCIGHLPVASAYGASANTPHGLVMIGGCDVNGALSTVNLLTINPDLTPVITPLPSLPATLDNMAAAAIGSKVYVAGGNLNGIPSRKLFCLDLDATKPQWVDLGTMPGNPRTQPVMVAAPNGNDTDLYLWGGFAPSHLNRDATLNVDGLRYSPRTGKWHRLPAPRNADGEDVSLGGGVAVTLPSGNIIATGGVNKDIFLNALRALPDGYLTHDPEWYRFNPLLLCFDTASGHWMQPLGSDLDLARAGAAAVLGHDGNILYILGGEIKPRLRTPYNTAVTSLKP